MLRKTHCILCILGSWVVVAQLGRVRCPNWSLGQYFSLSPWSLVNLVCSSSNLKLVQFDTVDNLTFRYLKYSSRPELILSWSKDLYKSDFRDRELRWQLHWHEEQWPGREWGVIWPRLRNDRTQVASVLVPLQAAPWPPTITHPHILYISFIQCLPHTQHGLGHWCWLKNMECIPLSGTSWLAGYVKLMPWQFRSRSDHRH